jgi:hypothetical protein
MCCMLSEETDGTSSTWRLAGQGRADQAGRGCPGRRALPAASKGIGGAGACRWRLHGRALPRDQRALARNRRIAASRYCRLVDLLQGPKMGRP